MHTMYDAFLGIGLPLTTYHVRRFRHCLTALRVTRLPRSLQEMSDENQTSIAPLKRSMPLYRRTRQKFDHFSLRRRWMLAERCVLDNMH
jgi:hypothetical protein